MTDPRGIRERPEEFGRRILPPEALTHAPEAVKKANAAAAEALDGYRTQLAAQRQADVDARNADQADRNAIKAALDQGKPAPKPTAEAKRQAVDHARNVTDAAYDLVADRFAQLDHEIRANHAQWIQEERDTLTDAAAKAQQAVAKAAEAFTTFEQRTGTIGFLKGYEPHRTKTQQVRPGSAVLTATGEVPRNPAALLAALHSVCDEFIDRLSTPTQLEHQAAEQARAVARRAIQHQRRQQQQRTRKTTTGFTTT